MTEIEYEVREEDLIAFNEFQLHQTESLQKMLRRHQAIVPGIFGLIAMGVLYFLKDIPAGLLMGSIAAAWGTGVPYYLKWSWRKQIKQLYTDEDKAKVMGHYKLRILTHELVEITDSGESRIHWKDVLRVDLDKKYAFIFVSLDSALIIPRATVKKGNLHEFVKQVDKAISAAE